MDTNVYTPMNVFHLPRYFVVPLFQRPYVWAEEAQWQPLWQDVRRMADLRITSPSTAARHFLGAIVLQAQDSAVHSLETRNVIDGQQRITTLQLLMDATAAVLESAGLDTLAERLDAFTHNPPHFVPAGEERLKLRHTNRDRAAFDEVMEAPPPVAYEQLKHAGSLIVGAHRFFAEAVSEWLGNVDDGAFGVRASALTDVLTNGLQLVVIDLQASENSQEIFETLNARGTPLTGADLIKNYVFQRLEAEGVDTMKAYAEDWPFESKFWESEVSVGRYTMTRGSLFLNQWLGARVGEEVSPRTTFSRFKVYVEHGSGLFMRDLLPVIKRQADIYEAWTVATSELDRNLSVVEMSVYRMQAAGVEVLKPVLIWLHEPERAIPTNVVDAVVSAFESWMVRRQILRLASADMGRVVAEAIRLYQNVPADQLASAVINYLASSTVTSTYWPGDDEVRAALEAEPAYRRYSRGRLRMMLEAAENRLRVRMNQPQVPRRGYPIEHVLPQKWETGWPVDGLEAQQARAAHVHRLGNLTLLTRSLNSSVSNGPWVAKRAKFQDHDTFLLNRQFLRADATWDEAAIEARGGDLVDSLLKTWPVPAGHLGEVLDRKESAAAPVEFKDVVGAGSVAVGAILVPREGKWSERQALVRADGKIEIDGRVFDTPSGAATYVKSSPSNGWYFWRLEDGTRLADVRAQLRAKRPRRDDSHAFDWSRLHEILERLPEGYWTSYIEVADAVGTVAQAVGNHVASCTQCSNAYRVLTYDGQVSPSFRWADAADTREPSEVLAAEGLTFLNGRADPSRALISDDLIALVSEPNS